MPMKGARAMAGLARAGILAWALALGPSLPAPAQVPGRALTAAEVKAQYVVNVARCVDWPPGKSPRDQGEFRIGVLRYEGLEDALHGFEGQTVKGRRIVVQAARDPKELLDCPVICLGEPEGNEIQRLVRTFRGLGALTFGESEAFHRAGGVVRFQQEGGRIRLVFNRWALQESGLKISSRLLSITPQVDP